MVQGSTSRQCREILGGTARTSSPSFELKHVYPRAYWTSVWTAVLSQQELRLWAHLVKVPAIGDILTSVPFLGIDVPTRSPLSHGARTPDSASPSRIPESHRRSRTLQAWASIHFYPSTHPALLLAQATCGPKARWHIILPFLQDRPITSRLSATTN